MSDEWVRRLSAKTPMDEKQQIEYFCAMVGLDPAEIEFTFPNCYPFAMRPANRRNCDDWVFYPSRYGGFWSTVGSAPAEGVPTHWVPAPPSPAEWTSQLQSAAPEVPPMEISPIAAAELERLSVEHDLPVSMLLSRAVALLKRDMEVLAGELDPEGWRPMEELRATRAESDRTSVYIAIPDRGRRGHVILSTTYPLQQDSATHWRPMLRGPSRAQSWPPGFPELEL